MIYTIGHKKNYTKALKPKANADNCSITPKPPRKIGREEAGSTLNIPENYRGGYAFKTAKDAQARIDEMGDRYKDFGVFGLDAEWDVDTIETEHGWWHNLIHSSYIILLES